MPKPVSVAIQKVTCHRSRLAVLDRACARRCTSEKSSSVVSYSIRIYAPARPFLLIWNVFEAEKRLLICGRVYAYGIRP